MSCLLVVTSVFSIWLFSGLFSGLFSRLVSGLVIWLVTRLFIGLFIGLFVGLLVGQCDFYNLLLTDVADRYFKHSTKSATTARMSRV